MQHISNLTKNFRQLTEPDKQTVLERERPAFQMPPLQAMHELSLVSNTAPVPIQQTTLSSIDIASFWVVMTEMFGSQWLNEYGDVPKESAAHLERFKKEKDKAIKDGISLELNKRETEIRQLEYRCESLQKQADELRQTKSELDEEVGTLAVHKKSIKEIKENLTFIIASFSEAFDTATMPPECLNDWKSIHYAISQIKSQIGNLLEQKSNVIDVSSLISNLNDIESTFGVSELAAA